MLTHLKTQAEDLLWHRTPTRRDEAIALSVGRHAVVLIRDMMEGQLSMRAMSLVYTTLLSIVPLLALGFSTLKALGVHNSLEPFLLNLLSPLGSQAGDVVGNVISFVENIKVGVLGSLGVGLLIFAAVSMIQKVEGAFNYIWRIEKSRGIGQRFGEYMSVLTFGPLVVVLAMGMTASALNNAWVASVAEIEPLGFLITVIGRLVPYLLIIGLFTFLYAFIPNTRVRFKAAAGGALLAGVLWQSASLAFASFVAGATNYNAIYSGFAIMIFLLIWLYVGWIILLAGCQLAFYLQHPEHLAPERTPPLLASRATEVLGLRLLAAIGHRFMSGEAPATAETLSRELRAEPEHVDRVLAVLAHHGIVTKAASSDQQILPARDLATLTMADLWRRLRLGFAASNRLPAPGPAEQIIAEAEDCFAERYGDTSVRDWLLSLTKSSATT